MMSEGTVTSKGQITIPAPVRRRLGLRPGDRVQFQCEESGTVLRPIRAANPFAAFAGCLSGKSPATIAEIVRKERESRGRG